MKRSTKALSLALLLAFLASGQVADAEPAPHVVWLNSGARYHRADCRYVKERSNLRYGTPKAAGEAGKNPCKVCKPKELE